MRIGFCGAHRVGKTTLARQIARIYQLPLLTNRVSNIVQAHGFNMATDNRLDTGVAMQSEQLTVMLDQIEANPNGFVSDRTPLDAAAYFMADAHAGAGDHLSQESVVQYVERCMALTAKHFDAVILVPPAITFEPMDGKPPLNAAYQEHLHLLIRGMAFDESLGHMQHRVGTILRENNSRLDRMTAVLDFVDPIAKALGHTSPGIAA